MTLVSSKLINYLARREGIVLVPYRDGAGYSIGAGHFLGKTYPGNKKVTVEEAIDNLHEHAAERERVFEKIAVPLEQHQLDALLSLYYQGGSDGFDAVVKIINARKPDDQISCLTSDREAAREMLNWDTSASGEHMRGLFSRRGREVAMFAAGEYGSDLDKIPLWDEVDPETKKPRKQDMKWHEVKPGDFDRAKGKKR
jgi:GH24 family phage-related lysozyme (muramidase)